MKKITWIVIIVCLILILAIVSYFLPTDDDVSENRIFHFEVKVTVQEEGNYTFLFPVPIASRANSPLKNMPTALLDNLTIDGVDNYSIISSEHGYALQINASNSFHVIVHKDFQLPTNDTDRDYIFDDISMPGSTHENHWIFFNGTDNNVLVNYSCYKKENYLNGSDFEWGFTKELDIGWNEFDMLIYYAPDI